MKKGISPIISTVLLIVISILAVMIIAEVVIPFVRESLAKSKECFEVIDQLEIDTEIMCAESLCTCYYNITANRKIVNMSIKRGMKEIELEGFIISISGGGSAETFEIKKGQVDNVQMLNGSSTLIIPKRGGLRTYSMNTTLISIDYAEIAPILKGEKVCESTDKADIERCSVW